jgi:chromosomal replication initiator protein
MKPPGGVRGRAAFETKTALVLARLVSVPENRSGRLAVERVAACIRSGSALRSTNPLYLHGPAGTGKTLLVSALAEQVQSSNSAVMTVPAADFATLSGVQQDAARSDRLLQMEQSDLLIIEDLQHLARAAAETLVGLFDHFTAIRSQIVVTASVGPCHLDLPARLTNRLASGLVVRLEFLQAPSRLAILEERAQRHQLAVSREVLAWLADRLAGGGRQLDGALARLEVLSRTHRGPIDMAAVSDYFQEQLEASRPTVERIVERVSGYFHVHPRQIQSSRRLRQVMLPRQVSMYLARQLTDLSLEQIGRYFGGRDHSTVLYACRKLQKALRHDAMLSGAVCQLRAGLA